MGDLQGALRSFEEARRQEAQRIRVNSHTMETVGGAVLMRNVAEARWAMGDLQGALRSLEEARRLREVTGTLNSAAGATVLKKLGDAHVAAGGGTESASRHYELALQILDEAQTLDTPAGRELLLAIQNLGMQ